MSQISRNKFVETTLAYVLTYIYSHSNSRITPASATILADSDYYSQSHTSSKNPLDPESRFLDFNVSLGEAHKTGLGSSAALVTALTAALIAHYLPDTGEMAKSQAIKRRVHNLAQAAHCTAQGKIGSGFDVAAAVYGSCIYRRFSPGVLERLGEIGNENFSSRLRTLVDDDGPQKIWDTQIRESAVTMPKGLRLVMCDVDCGSETPGMVKKVFAWRKDNTEEALLLWETLQRGNEDLAAELQRLSGDPNSSYENLQSIILTVRSLIREMSTKADVPIEPEVQTELLDICSEKRGVIGGVVPGAGGYDALALIVEEDQDITSELATFLASYKPMEGSSAGPKIGKVRLLDVRQEMEGIKAESAGTYRGWLDVED